VTLVVSAADGRDNTRKASAKPNTTDDRIAPGNLIGDLIGPSIAGTGGGVNGYFDTAGVSPFGVRGAFAPGLGVRFTFMAKMALNSLVSYLKRFCLFSQSALSCPTSISIFDTMIHDLFRLNKDPHPPSRE
jgi:hypothetical protein